MTDTRADWRLIGGVATAWFEAPSLSRGAVLAACILEIAPDTVIDLRPTGLRVRLDAGNHAEAVSAAAADLGLGPHPEILQDLSVVIESPNPIPVANFWQRVLAYTPTGDGGLVDPLRRDPAIHIRPLADDRPLRNRIHVDVVRPSAAVEQADLGEPFGPYGVCHADADGNEVDFVPGDALSDRTGTDDWVAVFSAMACYRTASPTHQRELTTAAAALADDMGFALLIDVRPGLVIIDSGKDQWEPATHGLDRDFIDLAEEVQTAARNLGAIADRKLPRFAQLFLDAADVTAVRAFWTAALGYTPDRRSGVTDIHDLRRLNPVFVFQQLDATDTERRRQRNRIHLELAVPPDVAATRVATAVAAGGRVVEESANQWRIADPELNEVLITSEQ